MILRQRSADAHREHQHIKSRRPLLPVFQMDQTQRRRPEHQLRIHADEHHHVHDSKGERRHRSGQKRQLSVLFDLQHDRRRQHGQAGRRNEVHRKPLPGREFFSRPEGADGVDRPGVQERVQIVRLFPDDITILKFLLGESTSICFSR